MGIYILNWLGDHWGILIAIIGGIPGVTIMFKLLLCASCRKPRIKIEGRRIPAFEPTRIMWQLSIYNEELRGWRKYICKRDKLSCWVEAAFIVGDEIPQLDSMTSAYATWRDNLPEHVTLEPDSSAWEIELLSQISSEVGFHIKRPTTETLLIAEDVLVVVLVKTGKNKIYAKATWAIYVYNGELIGERLE